GASGISRWREPSERHPSDLPPRRVGGKAGTTNDIRPTGSPASGGFSGDPAGLKTLQLPERGSPASRPSEHSGKWPREKKSRFLWSAWDPAPTLRGCFPP